MADDATTLAAKAPPRLDPVWRQMRQEGAAIATGEPLLAGVIGTTVLDQQSFEDALIARLGARLEGADLAREVIGDAMKDALEIDPDIGEVARVDACAVLDRDPACHRAIEPLLYFKGFQAIQTHRFAHALWSRGRKDLAFALQSRASQVYQLDIHPAVPFGRGIFFDHGTGVVIGETSVIEDNVSVLHGVTLGGTGNEEGERHPKIRCGVLIGAGASILGNISVGPCARVAAGSVVLNPVPPKTTVAGVPARVVGEAGCPEPARAMDQILGGSWS